MNPNESEAVIDEIRQVRHRISERFGHDPQRLVAYYIQWQQRCRDRLIESQEAPEENDPSAA